MYMKEMSNHHPVCMTRVPMEVFLTFHLSVKSLLLRDRFISKLAILASLRIKTIPLDLRVWLRANSNTREVSVPHSNLMKSLISPLRDLRYKRKNMKMEVIFNIARYINLSICFLQLTQSKHPKRKGHQIKR